MKKVNVTEFRQNLPSYLSLVQKGTEICVTSHGRVIAHILPPTEPKKQAKHKLEELRGRCVIGDVITPVNDEWDVEQ